jgi:hypothetical protein
VLLVGTPIALSTGVQFAVPDRLLAISYLD